MESLSSDAAGKRIKFENPPINELVIALFHLPIVEMKAQHIGIYWHRIRDKYPVCEQQPMIVNPSDTQPFQEVPGEVFPLPRFWFSSDAHPTLIQIQRNAFIFNWRRLPKNEYPHYETVVTDFWRELRDKIFVQGLGGRGLDVIQRCELTYLISPNEFFANPSQLMQVLPSITSLAALQADDRQMVGLNATATYQVNPTLRVDLAIKLGRRTDETKELVAVLELKAYGAPSGLSLEEARSWYGSAHDATYKMFLDTTAKQVQELIWKPL
jgi:uncharacterized protein (TIGR04255 family)